MRISCSVLPLLGMTLLGCGTPDDAGDDIESESGSSTASPETSTTGATTGPPTSSTTSTSGTSTGEPPGSGTSGTGASSGDVETCEPGLEPAVSTVVEGCPDFVGESFCSEGQAHVAEDPIAWEHNPPHSGPHDPMWVPWGESEQTVPRRNWVHNLEHGGIVLSYVCPSGCDAELEVLREVRAQRPELRILLTPDPELVETQFAAVSWTWVYTFESPDLATLLCFVDQHEGNAPEDVP